MSNAGKLWLLALLTVAVVSATLVAVPVIVTRQHQTPHHPTATSVPCADESVPGEGQGTIWLAKPDGRGHYLVVSTDNLCVAQDEQAQGFYPVPEWYAKQLAGR